MALGFKEKRALQAIVDQKQSELAAGSLSFSKKREAQKALDDAVAKLNEQIDANPESAQQNQKLADLIAGKFNDQPPIEFLATLHEILNETNDDIEPVKSPTIKYIELKKAA